MPRAMQASGDVFRVRHKESGVVCVFKVFCAFVTALNRHMDREQSRVPLAPLALPRHVPPCLTIESLAECQGCTRI